MSDQELLREYASEGSERAFQTLVERHLNLIYSTALRQVTDAGLAREVTQNVFIALARKAAFIARDVPLAAWLHRTAVLEGRHQLRAELRRKRREATAVEMGVTMKEEDSLLKSLGPVLDEALLDLREKDRQALLLRFCENKSLRETGQSLGIAEDAAQKRVAGALDRLARVFRRRGYNVPAVTVAAAALQGATQNAPAGLASVIAQGAFQHAGAVSLSAVGLLLAKIMSLTKAQTAALCLVAATIPVTYEWNANRQLRREQTALQAQLATGRGDVAAREAELDELARRLRDVENQMAADLAAPAFAAVAVAATDPSIYLWSEESRYIHVPKQVLKDLGMPAVDREIRLSQLMADTLSLQRNELEQVNAALANLKSAFAALEASHATPSEKHIQWFHPRNNGPMRSFLITPFADEGRQLMTQLKGDLEERIGAERTRVLWPHAEQTLRQKLSEVGAEERLLTVYVHANSAPRFYEAIQRGSYLIRGQGIDLSDRQPPAFLKAAAEELQRNSP
jgi:RNA polymerase sigma factor (sigma-70 family)